MAPAALRELLPIPLEGGESLWYGFCIVRCLPVRLALPAGLEYRLKGNTFATAPTYGPRRWPRRSWNGCAVGCLSGRSSIACGGWIAHVESSVPRLASAEVLHRQPVIQEISHADHGGHGLHHRGHGVQHLTLAAETLLPCKKLTLDLRQLHLQGPLWSPCLRLPLEPHQLLRHVLQRALQLRELLLAVSYAVRQRLNGRLEVCDRLHEGHLEDVVARGRHASRAGRADSARAHMGTGRPRHTTCPTSAGARAGAHAVRSACWPAAWTACDST
mmetsp:Transcript_30336/g.96991  ORF Transcript_30336/g.96991 Transcript_30336/m.96991 type:complete len:273 (+) Transcript_30336:259-1077(+)